MSETVVTCVYCGKEYPEGTPAAKAEILTEHIRVCEKHPLRDAEERIRILRAALRGLCGLDGGDSGEAEALDGMELVLRLSPAPEADKTAALNAIDALRRTA